MLLIVSNATDWWLFDFLLLLFFICFASPGGGGRGALLGGRPEDGARKSCGVGDKPGSETKTLLPGNVSVETYKRQNRRQLAFRFSIILFLIFFVGTGGGGGGWGETHPGDGPKDAARKKVYDVGEKPGARAQIYLPWVVC